MTLYALTSDNVEAGLALSLMFPGPDSVGSVEILMRFVNLCRRTVSDTFRLVNLRVLGIRSQVGIC
jgi:hypothetical protein